MRWRFLHQGNKIVLIICKLRSLVHSQANCWVCTLVVVFESGRLFSSVEVSWEDENNNGCVTSISWVTNGRSLPSRVMRTYSMHNACQTHSGSLNVNTNHAVRLADVISTWTHMPVNTNSTCWSQGYFDLHWSPVTSVYWQLDFFYSNNSLMSSLSLAFSQLQADQFQHRWHTPIYS